MGHTKIDNKNAKQKILLVDVDSTIPNMALMKLSTFHKQKGQVVELLRLKYDGKPGKRQRTLIRNKGYEQIYISIIFTPNRDVIKIENPEIKNYQFGGTGTEDITKKLPQEIDDLEEDYSLYPDNDEAFGFYCYDKKTEVLTKNGWKKFNDIKKEDKICSLNPKNDNIFYQKINKIYKYHYKNKLLSFKNSKVDLLITPNHQVYVNDRNFKIANNSIKRDFKLVKAEELFKKRAFRFKKNGIWKGKYQKYFYFPCDYKKDYIRENIVDKIPMNLWLEFLGYYLSEGNTQYKKKTRSYIIKIAQRSFSRGWIPMEKCLKKLGYNYYKNEKEGFFISNKQIYNYLKQFGVSFKKFIPDFIKNLPSKQIKVFFDAYALGDGVFYKRNNGTFLTGITSSSKQIIDGFQELFLKLGFSGKICNGNRKGMIYFYKKDNRTATCRHDCYIIFCNEYMNEPLYRNDLNPILIKKYNNVVYCLEVPKYNIIYVRRNGVPVWCGNSRGCVNNCKEFCMVPKKEGMLHKYRDWKQIVATADKYGLKKIRFLDNNFLANKECEKVMQELIDNNIRCSFNEGLDFRQITEGKAKLLSELRYYPTEYIFAFDNASYLPLIEKQYKIIKKYITTDWKIKFYCYVHPDMPLKDTVKRLEWCRNNKALVYIMKDKACYTSEHKNFYRDICSWTNAPGIYKYHSFLDHMKRKSKDNSRILKSVKIYQDCIKQTEEENEGNRSNT
jgi:hypothetical protein